MTSRLRERRSRLAAWSGRFAVLAVPVLVIAAVGHRAGMIDTTATYAAMALGFSLAAIAVVAALAAFEAIWRDGRKGLGSALAGFVLALVVLTIPAVGAWKIVNYPRLTDISTDVDDPPPFLAVYADRSGTGTRSNGFSIDEGELLQAAYPDIVSRYYPLDTVAVFGAAEAIVERRGWRLLDKRVPKDADAAGRIEAVAQTLLFGFKQDVAIRIAPEGEGTLVDMRSAARNGAHDLGADAERIRRFFRDLDSALRGVGITTE